MSQTETRRIVASPNIIRHLIESQAGTLGKAFVECVMNSIDAGATKVDIDLDRKGFVVSDDGRGFQSRDEILACFEVFGFEHDDREREFGKFGLGRAQLWNWSSTTWFSHTFELYVDVRERGLDYDLISGLEDHPGAAIHGRFYEALSEVDYAALLSEIDMLCKYVVIDVVVNGRNVRQDPASKKWTYEDERVWIKQSETSTLMVYNQGVFVRRYPASQMGIGGTLVTKRGHDLALNMSRSDVLTHKCELWKSLRSLCSELSNKETKRRGRRLSNDQRDYLASQCSDPDQVANFKEPLFTLSNGRHMPLPRLVSLAKASCLTVAARGDRIADVALQEKTAAVVAEGTLSRFGVSTPSELVGRLIDQLRAAGQDPYANAGQRIDSDLCAAFRGLVWIRDRDQVIDDFASTPAYRRANSSIIPTAQLTPKQRKAVAVLNRLNDAVAWTVSSERSKLTGDAFQSHRRDVCVGRCNCAEAFTDGSSFIAIEEKTLNRALRSDLSGWLYLANLLVHENIHDASDTGSHEHDHTFYELFHEVALRQDSHVPIEAMNAFREYSRRLERLNQRQAKAVDKLRALEKAAEMDKQGAKAA